jgi:hypothetical protein
MSGMRSLVERQQLLGALLPDDREGEGHEDSR